MEQNLLQSQLRTISQTPGKMFSAFQLVNVYPSTRAHLCLLTRKNIAKQLIELFYFRKTRRCLFGV